MVQRMKILTTLPQGDLRAVPAAVAAAEAAGFDAVITMENRNEPFLALGVAAVSSKSIGLATGVAIAFPRSPMVVANAAWDLQIASQGRFVLGLGPQIRPHNEKRFSTSWSPPVPRMREYVQALRAIWRSWELGEKLRFEGEHYTFTLMTPNFIPVSTGQASVPITIAAVGPHSLRLAGEACDGVRLHPFCTRAYLEQVCMPRIAEGMAKTARNRKHFEITGGGFIATGATDEEVAKALEWVRYRIAFYGSTPSYWPVLDHHGHSDLGRKLNRYDQRRKVEHHRIRGLGRRGRVIRCYRALRRARERGRPALRGRFGCSVREHLARHSACDPERCAAGHTGHLHPLRGIPIRVVAQLFPRSPATIVASAANCG